MGNAYQLFITYQTMNDKTLIYTTACTEENLRHINQYEFKRIWETNLNKNNKNLLAGIITILLGTLFFSTKNYGFAGVFAGYGITVCIYYLSYYSQYKKHKKKFQEIIERDVLNLKANSKDIIWEFTPNHFSFKNYKSEYKFIWNEITYCILDDQYLYITASSFMNFILDKANIDKENLERTVEYLENKAQFKKI